MDKDKSLQKITSPKSLEKIIEFNVLARRGLHALGIETLEDKLAKELNELVIKLFDQIFFRKLKNEKFAKFGKADAQIYLSKLDKLVDKIITFCQKSLKNIRLNSPLRHPVLFFLGFLLMSKKYYQEAIAAFSECLKQRDEMFHLLLGTGGLMEKKYDNPLLSAIFNDEKIIPTSKEFKNLMIELWNKFGKRKYACISTLAGDCFLKIGDRENALVYYQKSIDFLATKFTTSRPRTPIWRESHTYLIERYDEIIDILYKWKGFQAVDEFIHKNKNKYAPSEGGWLSHFFPNCFFGPDDIDSDRFAHIDSSKIESYLQSRKYSKKELIGYAIGIMYFESDGLIEEDIKESGEYALEITQSLKNIYPQDNEIDFIYNKMSRKYEGEILRLKQSD